MTVRSGRIRKLTAKYQEQAMAAIDERSEIRIPATCTEIIQDEKYKKQ